MVTDTKNRHWRKIYYEQMKEVLSEIFISDIPFPGKLSLPVLSRFSMCEFGGSRHSSGTAMLVATPSGYPNSALALKNLRPNGIHAVSKIWPGCMIAIAHHQYGCASVGIYQLVGFSKTTCGDNQGNFTLLASIKNKPSMEVYDLRWLSPYDKKYAGIKKLARSAMRKVESYECDVPIYLEPLKSLNKFSSYDINLLKHLDSDPMISDPSYSDLVPRCYRIIHNLICVTDYTSYNKFEKDILSRCRHYHNNFAFVYVLLVHHLSTGDDGDDELQTHGFILAQKRPYDQLFFHREGYLYRHTCVDIKSIEFESYLKNNYNDSYKHTLLGVHGGGIKNLLRYIGTSKDGCHYVPLKYSLCTMKYR